MKFMIGTADYSLLDQTRNEDILEELKVDPVWNKLAQGKRKWLNHVSRMDDIRYPQQFLDYWSAGRRRPGLLEGYNLEAETGHLLAKLRDERNMKNYSFMRRRS